MQLVADRAQFDELSRMTDPHLSLSAFRSNSLCSTEMGQVLGMQDAIRDVLPNLPHRVSLSLRKALGRHGQTLIAPEQNKTQTVHCFTLIRDVLRLVAEESADVNTVLTIVNDLDELLFELQAE